MGEVCGGGYTASLQRLKGFPSLGLKFPDGEFDRRVRYDVHGEGLFCGLVERFLMLSSFCVD